MSSSPLPTASNPGTLGQKIDALLEPLYAEAQQHRQHVALAREKIAELEAGLAESEWALGEIEGRMVAVLRSLASEEPLLGKVVGQVKAPAAPAAPVAAPAPISQTPAAAVPTAAPAAASTPVSAAPVSTQAAEALETPAGGASQDDDEAKVAEVAALLSTPVDEAQPAPAPLPVPANIADAAARAAAAAQKLQQNALPQPPATATSAPVGDGSA